MFLEDGSMNLPKEAKAQYAHKLENLLPQTTTMAAADCMIIDGSCIIRFLPFQGENFGALAQGFMSSVMATNRKIGDVAQTHIVFDRYFKIRPKAQTCHDRGSVEGEDITI